MFINNKGISKKALVSLMQNISACYFIYIYLFSIFNTADIKLQVQMVWAVPLAP